MASDARSTTHTAPKGEQPYGRWRPSWAMPCFTVTLALLAFLLVNAQRGAVSDRIRNPEVTGAPRPVTYLFGVASSTWLTIGTMQEIAPFLAVLGVTKHARKPLRAKSPEPPMPLMIEVPATCVELTLP